jgi:hypothetical protein
MAAGTKPAAAEEAKNAGGSLERDGESEWGEVSREGPGRVDTVFQILKGNCRAQQNRCCWRRQRVEKGIEREQRRWEEGKRGGIAHAVGGGLQ